MTIHLHAKLQLAAAIACAAILTSPAWAESLADECEDAFQVGVGVYYGTTADNTGVLDDTSCGYNDIIDEWYAFTATESGAITADTCGAGTNFDTTLAVFTSCALEFELDCNDDDCGYQSVISWEASAGGSYFIRISGHNYSTGEYELNIAYYHEGDECEDAFPVGVGTFTGTTTDNTGVVDDTSCATGDSVDEWYAFTAPQTGLVVVDTCGANTDFDTTLAVFTSCDLEFELACDDDFCGLQSLITWEAGQGTSYFIRVSGAYGATGDYELHIYYPATGDECDDAFPVIEGSYWGTTTDNTGVLDDTSCTYGDVIDEWYAYTTSVAGTATASICSLGASFDTSLAVFDFCGMNELACNDDYCGTASQISWPVNGGGTYYIRVSGHNGAVGDYWLTLAAATGDIDFYLDRDEFESLIFGGGMKVLGTEDFEEAVLPPPPDNVAVIDDPLDDSTNNGVFSPGDIFEGVAFQSNLDGPGLFGLNPRGVDGLLVLGSGYAGVPDTTITVNAVDDSLDLIAGLPIPIPRPTAVGMEVAAFGGTGFVALNVFDEDDNLAGLIAVGSNPLGTFVGATPIHLPKGLRDGNSIGRINLWNPGGWEGLLSVTTYGYLDCPADFDGDGDVDTADLLFLLGAWGTPNGDVDGDGDTDTADLLALLGAWGECP